MSDVKLVELGKSSYAVHYQDRYIGYVTKRASYWQGATAEGVLIAKPAKTRAAMVENLRQLHRNEEMF